VEFSYVSLDIGHCLGVISGLDNVLRFAVHFVESDVFGAAACRAIRSLLARLTKHDLIQWCPESTRVADCKLCNSDDGLRFFFL